MKKKAASIKLSDIVSNFQSMLEPEGKTGTQEHSQSVQSGTSESKTAEDKGCVSADTNVTDSLRKIASDAVTTEKTAMFEEAGDYGKVFARGFIEEMNKFAMESDAYQRGYQTMMGTISSFEGSMQKISSEAFDITIERIMTSANSPVLEKISSEAYEAAMDRISTAPNSPVFGKIAQEAYGATIERIATSPGSPVFGKIAQEAYAETMHRIDGGNVKLAQTMMAITGEAYDATINRIQSKAR